MRKLLYIGGAIVLGFLVGFVFQPLISGDNIFQQVRKFDKVLNIAFQNYVEDVDTQKLVEAAIKGMLNELDVHSVFIPAEEMKRVQEDFSGSFEGIGVEFDIVNDTITIVSPIPGGPSETIGIMAGDKIVNIDDSTAIGAERADVPKRLKGPKGTIVKVDIKRGNSNDLLHFSITRDKIPLLSVDASFMIENTDIGVVVINRFSATTHDELIDAMKSLRQVGMNKLILDLRGNPGGYLNQAFLMADEFVKRGDTIVYTKGRKSEFDDMYIATSGQQFENIPVICLINAGSASASEIVSGAIQDLDRGLVVGETSYGKGLVQRQYDIGDGSAFRLTISKYYTPSGRSIQRPYKDKDKYRHLVGRLELEEGNYIKDGYNKIIEQVRKLNEKDKKDTIDFKSLPMYKTKSGRVVFGGGGITPDYIVKSDTITKMSAEIRRQNLFFEFTDSYLKGKGKGLREKYKNNYEKFLTSFEIDDDILNEFKVLAESKGVTWNNEDYQVDKEYYQIAIKATIARTVWDRSKYLQIFYTIDKQVNKAVELFPEALRISKLK